MDDLISRKAAIKALSHGEGCGHVCRNAIKRIPSVPAVPLEPLCQWLAGYAAPPNYALEEVITGYQIQPNLPIISVNYRVEAWRLHFIELMKSGLMDTEGEDAEEKA